MHTINKVFNSLEKLASFKHREIQAIGEMEKAASTVSRGLRALLKARKASVARAMRKNPKLTRQQALDAFYKRYGLQVGKGGKISALEGAKLNNKALTKQQEWLAAMKQNKALSSEIKNLNTLNPKEVTSKRLRDLSQRFNLSEANGDYILAQQGGRQLGKKVNIKGKPMRFWSDQQIFKLNRKPSTTMSRLRRKAAPNTTPAPKPEVPKPASAAEPVKPATTPTPGTPKQVPAPKTAKPATAGEPVVAPDKTSGGKPGQYGPSSLDTPVSAPLGKKNSNWWKYLLGGAAGGYATRAITEPQPEPQDLTANVDEQYLNAMGNS